MDKRERKLRDLAAEGLQGFSRDQFIYVIQLLDEERVQVEESKQALFAGMEKSQDKIAALESQLAELQKDRDRLADDFNYAHESRKELQRELESLRKDKKMLADLLQVARTRRARYKAERDELRARAKLAEAIGIVKTFEHKHGVGHTMGFDQCDGCDLLMAFHKLSQPGQAGEYEKAL